MTSNDNDVIAVWRAVACTTSSESQ